MFLACEPLAGKRFVQVCPQRTRQDWAHFIQVLLDEWYSHEEQVILVMDNLNICTLGSLYETFPPEEAERIYLRLEIHRFSPLLEQGKLQGGVRPDT